MPTRVLHLRQTCRCSRRLYLFLVNTSTIGHSRTFVPIARYRSKPCPCWNISVLCRNTWTQPTFVRILSFRTAVERDVRNPMWTDEESGRACLAHMPFPRGVYPTSTFKRFDMPYLRFTEEVDFQARLQRLLNRMQDNPYFLIAGHDKLLELVVFEPPFEKR